MKTRVWISFLFILLLVGCSTISNGKTVYSTAKLDKIYKTMEDLKMDAESIIEVRVLNDSESINYVQMFFTVSTVEILQSIKGNFKEGDRIKILETGGRMPDGGVYLLNGVPIMQSGEKLLLFIKKYEGPITSNAFVPLGAYQGKFKEINNRYEQQGSDEHRLVDYSPMTALELIELLKTD